MEEKIDQVIEKEEELPTVLDNKEEEELPSFEAINEVEEKEEEITRTLSEDMGDDPLDVPAFMRKKGR